MGECGGDFGAGSQRPTRVGDLQLFRAFEVYAAAPGSLWVAAGGKSVLISQTVDNPRVMDTCDTLRTG